MHKTRKCKLTNKYNSQFNQNNSCNAISQVEDYIDKIIKVEKSNDDNNDTNNELVNEPSLDNNCVTIKIEADSETEYELTSEMLNEIQIVHNEKQIKKEPTNIRVNKKQSNTIKIINNSQNNNNNDGHIKNIERKRIKRSLIKSDTKLYNRERKREHERYLRRKRTGKLKLINEMNNWQAQRQRYKWRLNSSRYYAKKQIEKIVEVQQQNDNILQRRRSLRISSIFAKNNDIDIINQNTDNKIKRTLRKTETKLQKQQQLPKNKSRQLNSHVLGIAYQKIKEQEKEILKLKKQIYQLRKRHC